MDIKLNEQLWAEAITKEIINSLGFGESFYSLGKRKVKDEVSKHKYFAFRVPDIKEAETDKDQLSDFAKMPARGMTSAIKADIAAFVRDNFLNDEKPCDTVYDLLEFLHNNKIVFYAQEPMRVQGAYDLDHLSVSVVGDWQYVIGIVIDDI